MFNPLQTTHYPTSHIRQTTHLLTKTRHLKTNCTHNPHLSSSPSSSQTKYPPSLFVLPNKAHAHKPPLYRKPRIHPNHTLPNHTLQISQPGTTHIATLCKFEHRTTVARITIVLLLPFLSVLLNVEWDLNGNRLTLRVRKGVLVAGTTSSLGSSTCMGTTPDAVVVGGLVHEFVPSSWSAADVAAAAAASFIAFSSSFFGKIASKRSRHSFEWLGPSTAQALQLGVPPYFYMWSM